MSESVDVVAEAESAISGAHFYSPRPDRLCNATVALINLVERLQAELDLAKRGKADWQFQHRFHKRDSNE